MRSLPPSNKSFTQQQVEQGNTYFAIDSVTIAGSSDEFYLFVVDANEAPFIFLQFTADQAMTITVFEGDTTVATGGSTITTANHNRDTGGTNFSSVLTYDPTTPIEDGAALPLRTIFAATQGNSYNPGSVETLLTPILKAGETYLIKITNLSSTDSLLETTFTFINRAV